MRSKALALLLELIRASPPAATRTPSGSNRFGSHAPGDMLAYGDSRAKQMRAAVVHVLRRCFGAVCCLAAATPGSVLHDEAAQPVSAEGLEPHVHRS